MNNFFNYINELFTKPQILWSMADKVVFAIMIIIAICIITTLVLVICVIVEKIKKHHKRRK